MAISKKNESILKCYECPARAKSIFAHADQSTCESIDQLRQAKSFDSDQVLMLRENSKPGFYCLQSGHVKIYFKSGVKNNTVRICGPGDLIGYGDWHTGDSHGVRALSQGLACYLDGSNFEKEMRRNHDISEGLIKGLCKIINLKDERISGLENHSVRNRICVLLYNLAKKFGVQTSEGILIEVNIDRKTLSELSGTVIESFARIITQLEKEKIIRRSGRKITIIDKEKMYRSTYE